MRGVDLNVFAFDYDLTWTAFFLNGDETIYGRFGGRDGPVADRYLTLPGLKHAMRAALAKVVADPLGGSPQDLTARMSDDRQRWGVIIRQAGISLD